MARLSKTSTWMLFQQNRPTTVRNEREAHASLLLFPFHHQLFETMEVVDIAIARRLGDPQLR